MTINILIQLCGIYALLFCAFHLAFPKLFNWQEARAKIGTVNSGILPVLNLMLSYLFLGLGLLFLLMPETLTRETTGQMLVLLMTGFWVIRLILQPIYWPNRGFFLLMSAIFASGAGLHIWTLLKLWQ